MHKIVQIKILLVESRLLKQPTPNTHTN